LHDWICRSIQVDSALQIGLLRTVGLECGCGARPTAHPAACLAGTGSLWGTPHSAWNIPEHHFPLPHRDDDSDDNLCLQYPALRLLAHDPDVGRNHKRGPHSSMGHDFCIAAAVGGNVRLLHTDSWIFPDSSPPEAAS